MKIQMKWFLTLSFLFSLNSNAFLFGHEQRQKEWRNELFDKLKMQGSSLKGFGYSKAGPTNIFADKYPCEIEISESDQDLKSTSLQVAVQVLAPDSFHHKKFNVHLANSNDKILKEKKFYPFGDFFHLAQAEKNQKNTRFHTLQFDEDSKLKMITIVDDFGEFYNKDSITCEIEK